MTALERRRQPRLRASVGLAVVCAGVIGLAGCGGSSPTRTAKDEPAQAARPTAALSNADIGSAPIQNSGTRRGGSRRHLGKSASEQGTAAGAEHVQGAGKVVRARPNQNPEDNDGQAGVKALNPCKLVSRSEARSITGQAVAASIEAPLGPTCIYQFAGSNSQVTVSIESASFAQVTHQMSKKTRVDVGSRQAYCGTLGTAMLYVPVAMGRVLHVTAPCRVAQHFASLALSRLVA